MDDDLFEGAKQAINRLIIVLGFVTILYRLYDLILWIYFKPAYMCICKRKIGPITLYNMLLLIQWSTGESNTRISEIFCYYHEESVLIRFRCPKCPLSAEQLFRGEVFKIINNRLVLILSIKGRQHAVHLYSYHKSLANSKIILQTTGQFSLVEGGQIGNLLKNKMKPKV